MRIPALNWRLSFAVVATCVFLTPVNSAVAQSCPGGCFGYPAPGGATGFASARVFRAAPVIAAPVFVAPVQPTFVQPTFIPAPAPTFIAPVPTIAYPTVLPIAPSQPFAPAPSFAQPAPVFWGQNPIVSPFPAWQPLPGLPSGGTIGAIPTIDQGPGSLNTPITPATEQNLNETEEEVIVLEALQDQDDSSLDSIPPEQTDYQLDDIKGQDDGQMQDKTKSSDQGSSTKTDVQDDSLMTPEISKQLAEQEDLRRRQIARAKREHQRDLAAKIQTIQDDGGADAQPAIQAATELANDDLEKTIDAINQRIDQVIDGLRN